VGREFARFAPLLRRPALVRAALESLPEEQRHVLNQIAGFRFPVPFDALVATSPLAPPLPPRPPEPRRWHTDYAQAKAEWDAYQEQVRARDAAAQGESLRLQEALNSLDEWGLLRRDLDRDRYDLHPTARGYAFAFLEAAELEDIFARIRHYYESQPAASADGIRSFADARQRIEIYHALISAGRLDEAAEHYRASLGRALLARITTPYQIIELLRPLFPGGPGTLPALSNPRDQGYFANELAQALGQVGRTPEALSLLGTSLGAFVQTRHAPSLCATLIHYAGLLRDDRQIAAKLHVFELAHDLATASNDEETLAIARLFLLKHFVDTGQWESAETAYRAFIAMPVAQRTAYRQATAERLYAKMLIGQGKDATMALNLALELATESHSNHEERSVYALWGELGLQQGRPDASAQFFLKALNMAGGDVQLTANYTGGLARALAAKGRLDEARALVERGVSRYSAAAVYLTLGDLKKSVHNAIEAYEMAWADGPPFAFWWELQQAKKILSALGVPEPDLEPFDESSIRSIPYEKEIRTFIEALSSQGEENPA
jgi:tetratricopeptide (TPR) repeat protein